MPKFSLTVEGEYNNDNPYVVPEPKLRLEKLEWDGGSPPDVIVLPQGTILVKVARYLKPGDEYRYSIASVAMLVKGQLSKVMEESK